MKWRQRILVTGEGSEREARTRSPQCLGFTQWARAEQPCTASGEYRVVRGQVGRMGRVRVHQLPPIFEKVMRSRYVVH